MGQAVPVTPTIFEERPLPPVVLRDLLGLLRDAMLQGSRLRVGVTPPPRSELALLADRLDCLASQVRTLSAVRS
jgi:hypothetical protein